MIYEYGGVNYEIRLQPLGEGRYRATIVDREIEVTAVPFDGGWLLTLDGERLRVYAAARDRERWIQAEGETYPLSISSRKRTSAASRSDLTAQMPGQVREVFAQPGDSVESGQTLLILEAMKMEIRVSAPAAGRVKRLLVHVGDLVERGQRLVEME